MFTPLFSYFPLIAPKIGKEAYNKNKVEIKIKSVASIALLTALQHQMAVINDHTRLTAGIAEQAADNKTLRL